MLTAVLGQDRLATIDTLVKCQATAERYVERHCGVYLGCIQGVFGVSVGVSGGETGVYP